MAASLAVDWQEPSGQLLDCQRPSLEGPKARSFRAVRKQAFIGDEEFEKAVRKRVAKLSVVEKSYPFERGAARH